MDKRAGKKRGEIEGRGACSTHLKYSARGFTKMFALSSRAASSSVHMDLCRLCVKPPDDKPCLSKVLRKASTSTSGAGRAGRRRKTSPTLRNLSLLAFNRRPSTRVACNSGLLQCR